MTADLSAIIARLEAAEVGSRELDAEICVLFQYGGPNSEGAVNVRTDSDWDGDLLFEHGGDECCNPIPPVTTSLDAAIKLAKRVLPEMGPINLCIAGSAVVSIEADDPCADYLVGNAFGRTPALALCIAILRAKQEQRP